MFSSLFSSIFSGTFVMFSSLGSSTFSGTFVMFSSFGSSVFSGTFVMFSSFGSSVFSGTFVIFSSFGGSFITKFKKLFFVSKLTFLLSSDLFSLKMLFIVDFISSSFSLFKVFISANLSLVDSGIGDFDFSFEA